LVKIGGQTKELSFLPFVDFLLADLSAQKTSEQADSMCDGGFCNS
jgi:predicted component of type VI protein secretion system